MKKEISFIGTFNDPKFEGLTSFTNSLKKYLKNKGFNISINNLDADVLHFHSSGFLISFKIKKSKKKIYGLYSNINTNFFKYIKAIRTQFKYSPIKLRLIKKLLWTTISCLIPIFIKKYFLKKNKLVIVPTKYMKKILNIKNCLMIPIGIDTKKFKNLKMKNNIKFTSSFFGHPGTLKGFEEVIKVYKKMGHNIIKNLHFSGFFSDSKSFKKYEKNDINITYGLKNIVKGYCKSDVVILPYRTLNSSIGIPLTLIEAMACERAIITTNLPHIKEICGNTVIYVKPFSVKLIVNAINYLKDNPKIRKNLGKKARKRVIKYYDQKKVFKKYEKLYKKLNFS